MSVFLVIAGGALIAIGIIWRLNDIKSSAMAGVSSGTPVPGRRAQQRQSSALKPSRWARKASRANIAKANSPQAATPSVITPRLGRSLRVPLKIPLEVSGIDREGSSFTEATHTEVINRSGASITLRSPILTDSQLTIKNLQTGQSCKFRACCRVQELPGGLREWGVDCLIAAPFFWGLSFAQSPEELEEETVATLLECSDCHCREMTNLSDSQYRTMVKEDSSTRSCTWCGTETEWKFAVVDDDLGAPALSTPQGREVAAPGASGMEKRRERRRVARLPVSIRHEDGREEFTKIESISRSGVCCIASMELVAGDHVFLTLLSDEGPGETEFSAQVTGRRKFNEKPGGHYGLKLERK